MEGKVSLETLASNIEDLGLIVRAGFDYNERQFQGTSARFDALETKMDDNNRTLADRLSRVEHAAYQIQIQLIAIDEEMRGIHKVIDGINTRVFTLENRTGMMPLF